MSNPEITAWTEDRENLRRYITRYTKDTSLAEDIVQDVFLKVHNRLGQLRDSEKMKSWIYQIARNSIADYFRLKSRKLPVVDFDASEETNTLNMCAEKCIAELLSLLPEKYRQAIQLAEMEDHSQVTLSQKLNISYSGVKSRVQRARQMLRKLVNERYLIETDAYGNVIRCKDKVPCSCDPSLMEACK